MQGALNAAPSTFKPGEPAPKAAGEEGIAVRIEVPVEKKQKQYAKRNQRPQRPL
jgi:hypothetical protein